MLEGEIHMKSIEIPNPTVKTGGKIPIPGTQGSLRSLSGVDDTVSPRTLCDISQEFAFVEPLEAEIWLVSGIELIELSSMISMKCNHQICGFNMIQHDSTWFNHQDWELNQEILYIWYSIGLIGVVERILNWNTCLNSQIASGVL